MNIEKTISEHAVSDILTPMLESQDRIVTEDVAPLFDQATGLDTPPASGTVTTTIEESRNLITAIIRKAWTATLTMLGGASVISYIAAAYTYLRNRLQGNETYGIPDRRSEISASSPLAANLALLNDRKIGGVPEAADGMSLVHMLFGAYADIEELTDNNEDWGAPRQISIMSLFPNLKKLTLGISSLNWMLLDGATGITEFHLPYLKSLGYGYPFRNSFAATCELNFPELYTASFGSNFSPCIQGCGFKKFQADKMHDIRSSGSNSPFLYNCPNLEEIILPSLAYCNHWSITTRGGGLANNCPKLWKVVVGDLSDTSITGYQGSSGNGMGFPDCPKLIHLELGANGVDVSVSVDMRWWEPDSETLANPQFLENFRDYIALRLTDNGSGKTLTLSQAVRNAIHAAESTYGIENIIITQKGWTISPAPN